ncbi:MAG: hypothetical protein WCG87_01990 [Bacteroidota bacterium]
MDRIFYKMGYTHRYGSYRKIYIAEPKDKYCGKPVIKGDAGNQLIADKVSSGSPLLIARLGSTELSALYHYYLHSSKKIVWEPEILRNMHIASGFFPSDGKNIERFCEEMFAHLHNVDVMGVWYNEGEEEICNKYCLDTTSYIDLPCIEPYYFPNDPWSRYLKGKKVLVIHPFEESIIHQYKNHRAQLFHNDDILPEFELKTIKAVQSIAGSNTGYATWFDAYHHMCDQILNTDFEIALIGAGAYGLALGSFVKSLDKQAIHMGGASQLMFGILGKRWMDNKDINKYFNEHWKKPYPHETPDHAEAVENACYW